MVACATCAVDWMYTDLNGREGASTKLPLAGAPRPVVPGHSRKSANTSKSLKKVTMGCWGPAIPDFSLIKGCNHVI